MPTNLKRSDEALWLDPVRRVPDLLQLLGPYLDDDLAVYPVSRAVNTPGRYDAQMTDESEPGKVRPFPCPFGLMP